jgi:phosphopentomutase
VFISVGEADAFGHSNNYAAYLGALKRSDAVLGEAMDITQRLNLAGHRTTLVVTTDHGRDRDAREHGPGIAESARVWLAAAGYGVHRRGNLPSPAARRLADIAPAVRRLLGVVRSEPVGSQIGLPELFSN